MQYISEVWHRTFTYMEWDIYLLLSLRTIFAAGHITFYHSSDIHAIFHKKV